MALPYGMLYALGSRETHMRNIHQIGGGGGHGVFQLDNGTWDIPDGFTQDVDLQARNAAAMLANAYSQTHDWSSALNMYNSGHRSAGATTHRNYGPNVMARLGYLQQHA